MWWVLTGTGQQATPHRPVVRIVVGNGTQPCQGAEGCAADCSSQLCAKHLPAHGRCLFSFPD